jgi:RNA-directed DNA polymerase
MSGFRHRGRPGREDQLWTAADRFRRRQQRRLQRDKTGEGQGNATPSLAAVADPENLIRTFRDLRGRGGQAPGPDGLTYSSVGPPEAAGILRELSRAILKGQYGPQAARQVRVPKPGGAGHRTLTLRSIFDRVVSAALNRALTPWWERLFLPGSVGYRPGVSTWDLLARLEHALTSQGRWVLAIDDVRRAFDHMRVADVLEDHRRQLGDGPLLGLVEAVLRGHEGAGREVGIDQGDPYSPTALNVRLHFSHDAPFDAEPGRPPWFRYADNLVYACSDLPDGRVALERAGALLDAAGFALKGEDGPPVDLRAGGTAQVLGFTVSCERGRVRYRLGRGAWDGLTEALAQAHETDDPAGAAGHAVRGWVNAYGPALSGMGDDMTEQVLATAAELGFRETMSAAELKRQGQAAWERWQTLRGRVSPVTAPCHSLVSGGG